MATAQAKTIYQSSVRATCACDATDWQVSHQLAMSNDLCWVKTDSPKIEFKHGTNRWQFSFLKRRQPNSTKGTHKYGSAPTEREAQQQIFEFRVNSEPVKVQAQVRSRLKLLLRQASSSSEFSDDNTTDTMTTTSESESESTSPPAPTKRTATAADYPSKKARKNR